MKPIPSLSPSESQRRHHHAYNELRYLHDITFGRRPDKSFIIDLSKRLWSDNTPEIGIKKIIDYFDLKRVTMSLNSVVCYGSFGSPDVNKDIMQGYGEVFVIDMYSINEHRWLTWDEIQGLASLMNISPVPRWENE